jgi:hypothetical protein
MFMSQYQRDMRNLVLQLRNACDLYIMYDYKDSAEPGQPKQTAKILDLAEQIKHYQERNESTTTNIGTL